MTEPEIVNMPVTRREILLVLKRSHEATVETIAQATGITLSGTRQHLIVLERDGLIAHAERRAGAGRPKFVYRLTATGDACFPRHYAALTNELLHYVDDEDEELLGRIFDRRGQRRLADAQRRLAGLPLTDRVAELARILDEDGYLAEFESLPDGTYRITEHNCAVLSVAHRYAHACRSEIDFLRAALPDTDVTRVAHIIAGGHVCAYVITRKEDIRHGDAEGIQAN